jgi:two-component system response regulator YesN
VILFWKGEEMKLLIADDDEQIREGIKEGIDWASLGIDEVISASNGIEALELFLSNLPEIVVTDIRMPGLDGLSFLKRIKEIKPITKVIILSGFSDFEYLKKAIQFGAVDYELKPIKVRNLINLIKKTKEAILSELVSEEKYNKYLESFKENFIVDMLEGKMTDRNILLEGLKQYFGFDAGGVLLFITFEMDYYGIWAKNKKKEKLEEPDCVIKDIVENSGQDLTERLLFKLRDKVFIMMIKTVDSVMYHNNLKIELGRFFIDLNNSLESRFGLTLSAGISNNGNVSEILELYNQAKAALKLKLYTGIKSFNGYNAFVELEKNYVVSQMNEEDLQNQFLKFNFEEVNTLISNEFARLKQEKSYTESSIVSFCNQLMNFLIKITKESSVNLEDYINNKVEVSKENILLETIEDYRDYVLSLYRDVLSKFSEVKAAKHSVTLLKVIEYVRNNFHKDLTIEVVAEYVGKTPNYFSHLFKKEYGVSFSKYVNKIRIDKAKELLLTTNLMIYEIGVKVGYYDQVYFAQVFKKMEGYSPTELRKGKL